MAASEYRLDSEQISDRIQFLTDRAEVHREIVRENAANEMGSQTDRVETLRNATKDNKVLHLSCAATLLRDAAALSLMLDKPADARELLSEAGRLLLNLRAPAGFFLLELAWPNGDVHWTDDDETILWDVQRHLAEEHTEFDAPEEPESSPVQGQTATSQLLSLLQALELREPRDGQHAELIGLLEGRLQERKGQALEATGTPLTSYLALMSHIREGGGLDKSSGSLRWSFLSLLLRRRELLRAAQEDVCHWQQMPRPWLVLDPDLIALFALAIRQGKALEIPTEFSDDDATLLLPSRAALALQQEQGLGRFA